MTGGTSGKAGTMAHQRHMAKAHGATGGRAAAALAATALVATLVACSSAGQGAAPRDAGQGAEPQGVYPTSCEGLPVVRDRMPSPADGQVPQARAEGRSAYWAQAKSLVDAMALRHACAATIMVAGDMGDILPDPLSAGDGVAEALADEGWCGVMLTTPNMGDGWQLMSLVSSLHEASEARDGAPMLVAVDEEGGLVNRVAGNIEGVAREPSPAQVGEGGEEEARAAARRIGEYLMELGFDVDFAPVVDVRTDACDDVLAGRCLSDDPQEVAAMAAAQVDALASCRVAATAKHFPGLGSTSGDSHDGSVSTDRTLDELMAADLVPYRAAIDAGVPIVMTGHVLAPEATGDGLPASLSSRMLGVLRDGLGFRGVIMTDALNMGAALSAYPQDELAWRAVAAGADVALMPVDPRAARDAMADAVARGELDEARVRDAATRAMELRLALTMGDARPWAE